MNSERGDNTHFLHERYLSVVCTPGDCHSSFSMVTAVLCPHGDCKKIVYYTRFFKHDHREHGLASGHLSLPNHYSNHALSQKTPAV